MSNVGMSNVPCPMYLSNDPLTHWSSGHLVVGSSNKYIGHGTLDIPTFDIRMSTCPAFLPIATSVELVSRILPHQPGRSFGFRSAQSNRVRPATRRLCGRVT